MYKYLAMWDCNGLESLKDISEYEDYNKKKVFEILAERKVEQNPLNQIIHTMKFRATSNPQRFYEVYAFSSEIDECTIRDCFEHDPQTIVDAIRNKGLKIISLRQTTKPVII